MIYLSEIVGKLVCVNSSGDFNFCPSGGRFFEISSTLSLKFHSYSRADGEPFIIFTPVSDVPFFSLFLLLFPDILVFLLFSLFCFSFLRNV